MRRSITIAMVAVGLFIASCGSDSASFSGGRSTNGPITTTTPLEVDGTVIDVAHEFWHSGFHVKLDAAEVSTSQTVLTNRVSYWLTLRGEFANQGDQIATFLPTMEIRSGGETYNRTNGDPPRLRPRSTARGEVTFLIPEDLDFDTAVLVVGAEEESQARVPLGAGGDAVDLRPTEAVVNATAVSELADVHISGVSLRHDIPTRYEQLELGKQAMTLHFDVTSRGPDIATLAIGDITLAQPDGTMRSAELAELLNVPGSEDGETTNELSVTFIVDDDATGGFSLILQLPASLIGSDDVSELTVDFSL